MRQEQIDSFVIHHPYGIYLVGDILIGNPTNFIESTVINLDGLSMLDTIIDNLYIQNNSVLESTSGIVLADSFEGSIRVENNDNLVKLDLIKNQKFLNYFYLRNCD